MCIVRVRIGIVSSRMEADDERTKGNAAYASRAYEDAIAHYDRAYALSAQTCARSMTNKAAAALALGASRVGDAAEACVNALAIDSANALGKKRLERAIVRGQSFERAIDGARKDWRTEALARALTRASDARARGNALFKAGDLANAIEAYGEGLEKGGTIEGSGEWWSGEGVPGAALLFANRAACRAGVGDHEGALRDADAALARDESYQKARLRRAMALKALMRYAEAHEEFSRLFEELPGDASIAENVNACRKALGKSGEARAGVKTIEDMKTYMEIVNTKPLVFVDFTATWCGPCKMIAPVFTSLAAQFPSIHFLKVDVDANQDISGYERVSSMPTFAVYKYGKKVEGFSGADANKLTALCSKWLSTM